MCCAHLANHFSKGVPEILRNTCWSRWLTKRLHRLGAIHCQNNPPPFPRAPAVLPPSRLSPIHPSTLPRPSTHLIEGLGCRFCNVLFHFLFRLVRFYWLRFYSSYSIQFVFNLVLVEYSYCIWLYTACDSSRFNSTVFYSIRSDPILFDSIVLTA